MKQTSLTLFISLSSLLLCSCLGTKTALHMSTSNFGVDIDSSPPTTDIGLGRTELAVQPGYAMGRTPSSLMGFSARAATGGVFKRFLFGSSSVFATGQAASNLSSDTGGTNTPTDPNDVIIVEELTDGKEPRRPKIMDMFFGEGSRKPFRQDETFPVVSGTKTNYGLCIGWDPATQIPRSIKLGFNRNEMAYAPIIGATGAQYKVKLPSVLAVHQQDSEGGELTEKGQTTQGNVKFDYVQYLATGKAAESLAKQGQVKKILLDQVAKTKPVEAAEATPPTIAPIVAP